jgi:hypothetical protein
MKISNSLFLNISTITTNDKNFQNWNWIENGIATLDKNKNFYFDQYGINTDLNEKQLAFRQQYWIRNSRLVSFGMKIER